MVINHYSGVTDSAFIIGVLVLWLLPLLLPPLLLVVLLLRFGSGIAGGGGGGGNNFCSLGVHHAVAIPQHIYNTHLHTCSCRVTVVCVTCIYTQLHCIHVMFDTAHNTTTQQVGPPETTPEAVLVKATTSTN